MAAQVCGLRSQIGEAWRRTEKFARNCRGKSEPWVCLDHPVWFAHDSALEGDGFELPVPRQIGDAFTGAAPSSGASRAMRKVAHPCSAASARIGATLPQCQAARIVIRHPFNPAPHPQHHRWLALSNGLAHDQNPAAAARA